jgi:hypothetical protein
MLVVGHAAEETRHVVVLEINEEHRVSIKNTYYSCIYLTHVFYCFNKLSSSPFSVFYFLRNEVHSSFGDTGYLRKYGASSLTSLSQSTVG